MSSIEIEGGVPAATDWRKVAMLCALGFAACLATWGVMQWAHPFFTVADQYSIGMGASSEAREALLSQQARVDGLNAAVVLAVGGGLLAGVLALFAQPCCSTLLRLATSIVGGVLWGGMVGLVGVPLFAAMMPSDALPSPTNTGLAQGIAFALFGAGMGLLYGMYSRNKPTIVTGLVSGAIAGAAGGVLFPIISGLIMPSQSTSDFLAAGGMVRLLWLSLPMIAIAATVPTMCAKQARPVVQLAPVTS